MNLFIDCEFNGGRGQLISMAIVGEDGREFYEVVQIPLRAFLDPWVKDHVIPILGKGAIGWTEFYSRLFAFLDGYDFPTIIADHPADIQYFAESLITDRVGSSYKKDWTARRWNVDYVSSLPHNALADAKALRDCWNSRGDWNDPNV